MDIVVDMVLIIYALACGHVAWKGSIVQEKWREKNSKRKHKAPCTDGGQVFRNSKRNRLYVGIYFNYLAGEMRIWREIISFNF